MATIHYSTLINGSTVSFNPLTDVLLFDVATISAADLVFTPFGSSGVTLSVAGRSFTFPGVTLGDFTSTNLVLANGSQLVQANASNTYSQSLTGQGGGDLLVGSAADQPAALVATSSTGVQGNSVSDGADVSADGRYVAFYSFSSNLVAGDNNASYDIFVKDRQTGVLKLASADAAGHQGNAHSFLPSMSADGAFVAFQSGATNLAAADTNSSDDIFVKNLATGAIIQASTDSAGTLANNGSFDPSLSADGSTVAYYSLASNLVTGDTNANYDIFVKSLATGVTTRASLSGGGIEANGSSFNPDLSHDGRFVAFDSGASNLDFFTDSNGTSDVFVKNMANGSVIRVSVSSASEVGNSFSSNASISADGRYVAFTSFATNLVAGDTNGTQDIFVRDTATGTTTRVSTDSLGGESNGPSDAASISADGRYVAFYSFASNLVAGDTNGSHDVFVKDMVTGVTTLLSSTATGTSSNGSSFAPTLSADGQTVAYTSFASDLVAGDSNGTYDIIAISNPLRFATLTGGLGNDTYVIANARDQIVEALNGGTDTVRASISYTLGANLDNLVLTGEASINATGNTANNVLTGNAGDNVLDGGLGTDTASYALASEGVGVDLGYADVQDTGGGGLDTLLNIENLTGSAYDDILLGNDLANVLDGGLGADYLAGGLGNDTYVVNSAGDVVAEDAAAGTDSVRSSISWTLGSNLENLELLGTARINATGNALANVLTGNRGMNVLDGGAGIDTASYATALAAVTVSLDKTGPQGTGGGNIDTLIGIENLTGSNFADTLHGNAGDNVLNGGAGIDTASYARATAGVTVNLALATAQITVGAGSDTLLNLENLTGSAFADTLSGNTGANVLDGGLGADTLAGGAGNDTYLVDSLTDVVTELAAGGTDTVVASVSLTLAAEVENLTLAGSANLNGTGNALANVLTGNAGSNILNGGAGTDTVSYAAASDAVNVNLATGLATGGGGSDSLIAIESVIGSAFADTLVGNAGANSLTGGLGADTLIGGDGSDSYNVDDVGDVVSETNALAAGGSDTVNSTLGAYTLGANVENGRVLATGAANLSGNALDNTLIAGTGNNVLDGGAGSDTASYAFATAAVTVSLALAGAQATGSSGSDTLVGIENLAGSNFADQLAGDGNANLLNGNLGIDTLTGGAGTDTFRFATALGATNVDTVTDFSVVDDSFQLENAIFTALTITGTLGAANFRAGAGVTTALDINDFVMYDSSTGALYYDADGSGAVSAAVRFATVTAGSALTNLDFVVT